MTALARTVEIGAGAQKGVRILGVNGIQNLLGCIV
jgi:hypothetical protein